MLFKDDAIEEIEIQDAYGEIHKIKTNVIGLCQLSAIEALQIDNEMDSEKKILEMLKIYFDVDVKFWKKFSVKTIIEVSKYMQEKHINSEVKKKTKSTK